MPARLPPYAYVPGLFPHPVRDPQGHGHGRPDEDLGPPPGGDDARQSQAYRYVLELFNAGYYWEAHEGLEKWWRETPAGDPRRPLWQGLLRLAAAGVKAREGRVDGVRAHAARAAALVAEAAERVGGEDPRLLGLRLRPLALAAEALARGAGELRVTRPLLPVEAVLPVRLEVD